MTVLLTFVFTAAGIASIAYLIRRWMKFHEFSKIIDRIPGPPAIPIFGNTHMIPLDRRGFAKQLADWCSEYGKDGIYRIWIGPIAMVFFIKAETSEPVLTSNKLIQKSSNYNLIMTWLGTGLLTSTGDKWRSRRKMLTPTFHFSILNSFVDVFNEQAKVMVAQLSTASQGGRPFDLFPYVGRCALDIICETAMGVSIQAQTNHDSEYVHAVQRMSEIVMHYERKPWLWIKPIFYAFGYGGQYQRSLKTVKNFTENVIQERSELYQRRVKGGEAKPSREAFLDLLLSMQGENKLTNEDIREEVDTFMFEGHDTTTAAMAWAIYLLGHHPEVQRKVADEMFSIFGDSDRSPTADDLKQMKYLECVVKESLRIFPSVPWFARSCTENFVAGPYQVPEGCNLNVAPFFIHRDTAAYGEDVEEFRPERFEMDETVGRNPYAFVPFSAGPRNCIGQRFALMEEKAVLSAFVRHFRVESMDARENVHAVFDLILRPYEGIKVKLTPRK